MSKPSILLTRQIPASGLEMLQEHGDLLMWQKDSLVPREWLLEHISNTAGLLCLLTDHIDKTVLDAATNLEVVSTMAVGFDNINVAECTKRGIPVGHTPGVLTETTADFAFALLMAAARRIVEGANYVKQGLWNTWSPTLFLGPDLHSATLGIVGFGRIGRAVAKRAKGFGMRILVCGSSPTNPSRKEVNADIECVDLPTLLEESDFVSLHVPLMNETHHLIGQTELECMKHTAILINTSRGAVVDSRALYRALAHHDIAYAALDVTDPEPISCEDPLLTLSNCLIVPHMASASIATRAKMAMMAATNLLAGLAGEPLPHCVNTEVYNA